MANKLEAGKIYAKDYGYSICAYDFWLCVRTTDKSAWLVKLKKKWVSGDGQQGMVVCTGEREEGKPKVVRQGTFMGSEYTMGKELYEDHCD